MRTDSILRPVQFPAIDGIRFYAAFAVFLQHVLGGLVLEYFFVPAAEFSANSATGMLRFVHYLADGNHGVDVFFIISGFLMARIILGSKSRFSYANFISNRVRRIYPAFFISLVVAAIGDCLLFGWTWDAYEFGKNLLFLNAWPGLVAIPYNHVTWSLGFEFAFYLVAPCLLVAKAFDKRLVALILLMLAAWALPASVVRMTALFVGAVIGSFSDEELVRTARRIPLAFASAAFLGVGIYKAVWAPSFQPLYFIFLSAASLLFVKVVWDDRMLLNKFFSSYILRWLGTLSYSIYLFHSIVASIVLHFMTPRPASMWGAAWAILLTAAITLLCAYASYVFVEQRYFVRKASPTKGAALEPAP